MGIISEGITKRILKKINPKLGQTYGYLALSKRISGGLKKVAEKTIPKSGSTTVKTAAGFKEATAKAEQIAKEKEKIRKELEKRGDIEKEKIITKGSARDYIIKKLTNLKNYYEAEKAKLGFKGRRYPPFDILLNLMETAEEMKQAQKENKVPKKILPAKDYDLLDKMNKDDFTKKFLDEIEKIWFEKKKLGF